MDNTAMNQTHHMKPIAAGLAGLGRNGDSMLVHMQPREVAGLQRLAMAHGGSLTVNPETGLPEAGFLGDVLGAVAPIALGFALGPAGLGLSSLQAGLAVGALGWAASGSLSKGIMSGLGGYGGAGLGGAIQGATPIVSNVTPVSTLGEAAAAAPAAASGAAPAVGSSEFWNATKVANAVPEVATKVPFGADTLWRTGIDNTANTIAAAPSTGATPMEAAWGVSRNSPTLSAGWQAVKADPMAFIKNNTGAAFTAASPLLAAASKPPEYELPKEEKTPYEGPYYPTERVASFPTDQERQQLGTKEYQYFTPTHPYPGYENYDPNYRGYAEGGDVNETPDPGSDPAEYQSGQYGAPLLNKSVGGIASFARGGYLDGPGDGMSDSISATIADKQPARLADGEFVVPADVVSHLGNGSTKAGAQRLYAMMDKVRKARTGTTKQGKQINPNKYMPA
jgi:hypothetical protein